MSESRPHTFDPNLVPPIVLLVDADPRALALYAATFESSGSGSRRRQCRTRRSAQYRSCSRTSWSPPFRFFGVVSVAQFVDERVAQCLSVGHVCLP